MPLFASVNQPGQFKRWLYRDERPHLTARVLNRGWAVVHSAGLWPSRLATVEVKGRKSGRTISFPVVIADWEGERYLVSMLGTAANWVRNVEAADGRAVLRHGRRERVRLEEVAEDDRPAILRRYLECAPGARPHFGIDRRASIEEFAPVAAKTRVFRITNEAVPPES